MGMFSWNCAKTGLPIASCYAGTPEWVSQCVLVLPDRIIEEPCYEGYGEFGGEDVYALLGDGDRSLGIDRDNERPSEKPFDIKIVLKRYYANETYEDLPASTPAENQGYFFTEENLYDFWEEDDE